MKSPLIHVASLVFNEPLAIIPEKLEAILRAIGPRLVVDETSLDELLRLHANRSRPTLQDDALVIKAQFDDDDEEEDDKPYRLTPEGIAVIPVRGTLMKRNSWMSAVSGLSSYAGVRSAASRAMSDPQVKGVLFDIDSPGGTTHGAFEASDMLYGLRGIKPMWASANDLAASAAYALASAADRVFVTRTGGVGSVGVFALHADMSAADEQAGLKFTYIFAGEKKVEGNPHEPLSKSAKADIQVEVDREYDIFVAAVARNRGFAGADVKKIAATQACVLFAENATPLLADDVATLEEALAALTEKVNGSKAKASGKLAISADAGNNAHDPQATISLPAASAEQPPAEGEKAMAKLDAAAAAEEAKRAKKADDPEAAQPDKKDPNEDDDPDDDGDEDEKPPKEDAKKGKKAAVTELPLAANAAAVRIATLCQIAGTPELASDYMIKGYTVDQVIEKLSARRAKASAESTVNSFVAGDQGGGSARASVDSAIEQARVMAANSGGRLTQSKCMEQLLRRNPDIYGGYLEEKDRVASQIMFSGGGRALTEYVLNNQRRYMANLGLGTTIDDVPGRRAM